MQFPVIHALHDPSEVVLNVWEGAMLCRIEACVLAHATQAGRQARALGLPMSEVLKAIQAMGQAIMGEELWESTPVAQLAHFLAIGLPPMLFKSHHQLRENTSRRALCAPSIRGGACVTKQGPMGVTQNPRRGDPTTTCSLLQTAGVVG